MYYTPAWVVKVLTSTGIQKTGGKKNKKNSTQKRQSSQSFRSSVARALAPPLQSSASNGKNPEMLQKSENREKKHSPKIYGQNPLLSGYTPEFRGPMTRNKNRTALNLGPTPSFKAQALLTPNPFLRFRSPSISRQSMTGLSC